MHATLLQERQIQNALKRTDVKRTKEKATRFNTREQAAAITRNRAGYH